MSGELAAPDGSAPERGEVAPCWRSSGSAASTSPAARSLSLGERTRALLAIFQAREVNVLVLDEPTNHLDVAAIEQLEAALADFPGTLARGQPRREPARRHRLTHRWHVEAGGVSVETV